MAHGVLLPFLKTIFNPSNMEINKVQIGDGLLYHGTELNGFVQGKIYRVKDVNIRDNTVLLSPKMVRING